MNDYFKKWCCVILFNPSYDQARHINAVASALDCTTHLYIDSETAKMGHWSTHDFKTYLLSSKPLYIEMKTAFENAFRLGFRKVILLRLNIEQVEAQQLVEGFNCLKMIEFCIGPTIDGDYYLIGMNYFEPSLFESDKLIASSTPLKSLIGHIGKLKLATYKLKTY